MRISADRKFHPTINRDQPGAKTGQHNEYSLKKTNLLANDLQVCNIQDMEKCIATDLLKSTNTKLTDARSKILDLILMSKSPQTANDLHKKLSDDNSLDLATVYRALKVFNEKGLVRTIHIDGDTAYYEKSCKHNPLHAHFHCESCGTVECLDPFGFDESSAFIRMAEGKEISKVELVIKGRCQECVSS